MIKRSGLTMSLLQIWNQSKAKTI